jgi:phosphoribosyl-dephospho-CoA transferase
VFRPHDLLWPTDAAALTLDGPSPAWATPPWLSVAPVVVRRAALADPQQIPVGLRGATRNERCAARLPVARVARAQSPEDVANAWRRRDHSVEHTLPCLQALAALAPALDALAVAWGVTGSVGFTLASGFDVLRSDSDLDLLVRAPTPADAMALRRIGALLNGRAARVDVQVETPVGAFALQEWLRTGGPVLLKADSGPVLCDDAWHAPERMIVA